MWRFVGAHSPGQRFTSCVLELADGAGAARADRTLNAQQRSALTVLGGLGQAQTGEWREATAKR